MKFAPYAVACLLFGNIARFGIDLLGALGWFVVTVLLGLGDALMQKFGSHRVELCSFTAPFKEEIFIKLRMESRESQ